MRLVEESTEPLISPPADIQLEVDIALGRPVGTKAMTTIAALVQMRCREASTQRVMRRWRIVYCGMT
jgi:hypothetical protein